MSKGNFETDKFTSDPKDLMKKCDADASGLRCGTPGTPHVFFDKKGMLHIVLYNKDDADKVKLQRHAKAGKDPHNADKAWQDKTDEGGDGGIYVHVYNSPPIDQVCPCKLNPNKHCPGSS